MNCFLTHNFVKFGSFSVLQLFSNIVLKVNDIVSNSENSMGAD